MITLNVYDKIDKTKVEKTYKAQGYDLMLGTVEDFMNVIDVDKLDNNVEIAKMVARGYRQIKPILHDVFPEITDEELNRVKVAELVQTIMQIGMAVADSLQELKSGNLTRA